MSFSSTEQQQSKQNTTHVFIGTYTTPMGHIRGDKLGTGIYTFRLNPDNGSLEPTCDPTPSMNPTFLCALSSGSTKYLYTANETTEGKVSSYQINPNDGSLTFVNDRCAKGADTCHVSVVIQQPDDAEDNDKYWLTCANYSCGSIASFPIHIDGDGDGGGSLGPLSGFVRFTGDGSQVDKDRQEKAHAHQCVHYSKQTRKVELYVPDLGNDLVRTLSLQSNGNLIEDEDRALRCPPGSGPRHLVFHPDIPYCYNIHELSSTVSTLRVNTSSNHTTLTTIQTVSTLPSSFTDKSECADIHLSTNGKFLYGSNRGHDSICIFRINPLDGMLEVMGWEKVGGEIPRNFGFTPDGKYMLVACQDTHTVNTFKVDGETGGLVNTGYSVHVPSPVCVCFVTS